MHVFMVGLLIPAQSLHVKEYDFHFNDGVSNQTNSNYYNGMKIHDDWRNIPIRTSQETQSFCISPATHKQDQTNVAR